MLIITDSEKWHYLAVKSLPALLKGITSNHNEDFYCLNCFRSCSTKNRFEKHEEVCSDHDYCYIEMPNEGNKTLKYNHGEKSLKVPFIIYVDFESLLEKIHSYQNNPKKSYTEHTLSGYSWIICCSFDASKDERGYYREKGRMEMFCKDVRDQTMKILNYEKKEMIPLIGKENESYEKQKVCHIYK